MKEKRDLRRQILGAFMHNNNHYYYEGYSKRDFFKEVYRFYVMLKEFEVAQDPVTNIMLIGKADAVWRAIYFAALLSGTNIFIVPSGMNERDISWYANRTYTSMIFVGDSDKGLLVARDSFRKIPFVHSIFNTWSWSFNKARTNYVNRVVGMDVILNSSDISFDYAIRVIAENVEKWNHSSKIITLTSGVESAYPKMVENTTDTLLNAVNILNLDIEDVQIEMHHPEKYHIWTVLYPLLNNIEVFTDGTYIDMGRNMIFDSEEFRRFWESVELAHLPKGFKKIGFCRRRAIRKDLKRFFDNIIILNADIPHAWIKLCYQSCNLITTFGSEETNHLIAWNDYSNKSLRKRGCIGEPFTEAMEIHDDKIVAEHLFHVYHQDEPATRMLKPRYDMVITDDKFSTKLVKKVPYLFYEGRDMDRTDGIDHHNIEKEISESPYVKNCVIAKDPDNSTRNILVIEPNSSFCDYKGIGLIGLKTLFRDMMGRINAQLKAEFISDVVVKHDAIQTTYDGKTKAYVYK